MLDKSHFKQDIFLNKFVRIFDYDEVIEEYYEKIYISFR